jgi:hypothetical protein
MRDRQVWLERVGVSAALRWRRPWAADAAALATYWWPTDLPPSPIDAAVVVSVVRSAHGAVGAFYENLDRRPVLCDPRMDCRDARFVATRNRGGRLHRRLLRDLGLASGARQTQRLQASAIPAAVAAVGSSAITKSTLNANVVCMADFKGRGGVCYSCLMCECECLCVCVHVVFCVYVCVMFLRCGGSCSR